jgi:AraC-like DNA-binding protein
MGESHKLDHGIVLGKDGEIDQAYRFVVAINVTKVTKYEGSDDPPQMMITDDPDQLIQKIIPSYEGRIISNSDYDGILAVFTEADEALSCSIEIQRQLHDGSKNQKDNSRKYIYKIGVGGGQPVTMGDTFFERALNLARRLSFIADERKILASSLVRKLSSIEEIPETNSALDTMHSADEDFFEELFKITEKNLSDHDFNVEKLCHKIGMSRSQLYRKVTAITGSSPVKFIRDLRLNKALSLIKENRYNLSEIALKIGFKNPSYFSKCFREKYGVKASSVAL